MLLAITSTLAHSLPFLVVPSIVEGAKRLAEQNTQLWNRFKEC